MLSQKIFALLWLVKSRKLHVWCFYKMSHWSLLAQFPTSPRCWRFVFMRNTAHPLQFSFIEITQQHHTLHAELRFYPESFCCNKWFVCVRFLERRKRINANTFINGADAAAAHYFWAASFNMCVVWIGTAFMLFCATMVGSLLKGRRYGHTIGSACVCAKVIHFSPSPFFFGSCTTFGFQKLQHSCCCLLHIFWHTGILDGMVLVVGFYGLEGAQ